MPKFVSCVLVMACLAASVTAQSRRVWVVKAPDAIVEYDPATFAAKQSAPVPADVAKAARILQINRQGQIDRKSTRLNSSHLKLSRMPSSA